MYIFNICNSTRFRLLIDLYVDCLPLTNSLACSLISIFSYNSIARSGKKTSVYSSYSLKISKRIFSYYRTAKNETRKKYINMANSGVFRAAT